MSHVTMEKTVEELRKVFKFKKGTKEGDIILVVMENPQAMFYGLVAGIDRDETKRDEWWHVSIHVLAFPPQRVVWTLRTEQFTGREIFTMGGEKRFIQAVEFVSEDDVRPGPAPDKKPKTLRPPLRLVK